MIFIAISGSRNKKGNGWMDMIQPSHFTGKDNEASKVKWTQQAHRAKVSRVTKQRITIHYHKALSFSSKNPLNAT